MIFNLAKLSALIVSSKKIKHSSNLRFFASGLLFPLGFAPFHLPGLAIISLAVYYYYLCQIKNLQSFIGGLCYGLGIFGFGVSWIYVSIHQYGHLHALTSAFITILFIVYLSLFPALMANVFCYLRLKFFTPLSAFSFSALWILSEYLRATLLGGFPWLLLGFGQFDAPTKSLLPIIGVYGVGFLSCLAAVFLVGCFYYQHKRRLIYSVIFILLLLTPSLIQHKKWGIEVNKPLSVGIIQANLSMRDKWDEALFWQLLNYYQQKIASLLGTQLIVMPESAIPLPTVYVSDLLTQMHLEAKEAGSAILLGIPQASDVNEEVYYNALLAFGKAKGAYLKQHLVPFGEYMPRPFRLITDFLNIPDANLQAGKSNQPLITVQKHPIASLICYELAYGNLLRQQLPQAEWIVSISDDGWFGHSLAMYQQQQIAQVRSLQTARYHVVANNDGLSAVINSQGEMIASLPAFQAGLLKSTLIPMSGCTPWVKWGDFPSLFFSLIISCIGLLNRYRKNKDLVDPIAAEHERRYPYQPV